VRLRRGNWRRLLRSLVVVVLAGAIVAAGSPGPASGSNDDVAYTGVRVGFSAAAVVDVRSAASGRRRSGEAASFTSGPPPAGGSRATRGST
jgi:hypothetical protein